MPLLQYSRMSFNNFEPTHNRFTKFASYEHLRTARNPEYTCISHLDCLVRTSFALCKNLESLHPLLEERDACFNHPLIFLQCYYIVTCITRTNRMRKPLCHAARFAGETDHPSPIHSFSSLVSCTHILTPSLPSFSPDIFHNLSIQFSSASYVHLSLAIVPPASNTSRDFRKYILFAFNHPSIELQGMRRRWCNE